MGLVSQLLISLRSCSKTSLVWDLATLEFRKMMRVSHWTVQGGIRDYGLEDFKSYSKLSDDELDKVVRGYIREHGATNYFPRYHSV